MITTAGPSARTARASASTSSPSERASSARGWASSASAPSSSAVAPASTRASGRFGVATVTRGSSPSPRARRASRSSSRAPDSDTITGSSTTGGRVGRISPSSSSAPATATIVSAVPSIPTLTASTPMSRATARTCARIIAGETLSIASTPTVLYAVIAVIAVMPWTPHAANAFRSAWIPAPPPESEPAIVSALRMRSVIDSACHHHVPPSGSAPHEAVKLQPRERRQSRLETEAGARARAPLRLPLGDRLERVLDGGDEARAVPQQPMRSRRQRRRGGTGHGAEPAAEPSRAARRDESAGPLAALDEHGEVSERGDDPVARGEHPAARRDTRPELGDRHAALPDSGVQPAVAPGIHDVGPAGQHGDRRPRGVERRPVCGGVDAERHPAHDRQAGARQTGGEHSRRLEAVAGGPAGADERDRRLFEQRAEPVKAAEDVEYRRRRRQIAQRGRIPGLATADGLELGAEQARPQLLERLLGVARLELAGDDRVARSPDRLDERAVIELKQLRHPLPDGIEMPGQPLEEPRPPRTLPAHPHVHAHAPTSASRATRWRRLSARSTSARRTRSLPARSAIVRATRITRSRPRALSSPSV